MFKAFNISSRKLLYLSIFSFVFIASFALSTYKSLQLKNIRVITVNEYHGVEDYPPIPILANQTSMPDLSAESVLAIDVDSGVVLYEKNPESKLFPASTTKMITALTALKYYDLEQIITIGKINVEGQKMRLVEGEEISVKDLISGLLIYSANDAAEVLAANYCTYNRPGTQKVCGREYFISAMNNLAKDLHLDESNFTNPTGLDNLEHLTTARDLTRIAIEGMKNPFFKEVVGTKEAVVESLDGKFKHKLVNLNELLGQETGVLGIKTGWTENARENLVTYLDRDGRKVVIVVLRSDDRFSDTRSLIGWIFGNYTWNNVKI